MILAIDPGPVESAFVEIRAGDIGVFGKAKNEHVLCKLAVTHPGVRLVIENISSYGMPVGREVFETCVWIGRFIQAFPGEHHLVYRKTVVGHVCKDASANDKNVMAAMKEQWGEPGTAKNPGPTFGFKKDMWSALAVATYALEKGKELAKK